MHDRVDEQQRVTCRTVELDRPWELIHAISLGVVPGQRMGEVRLVASGDHHGGSIPGADVGQQDEHVDLSASELAVVVSVLRANRGVVTS